jgi:hypothetical protein
MKASYPQIYTHGQPRGLRKISMRYPHGVGNFSSFKGNILEKVCAVANTTN